MAYEVAMILSYLGTSFILIYLSSLFGDGQKFLKLFLFSLAMMFLLINSNATYNLIQDQASNATLTTNVTQVYLENRADNGFYVLVIGFTFLVFYAFIMAFTEVTGYMKAPPKW